MRAVSKAQGFAAMGVDGRGTGESRGWSLVRAWAKEGLSQRKLEKEHAWARRTRTGRYPQTKREAL